MSKQRISTGDIQVGQPLKWAVFDTGGKLLLREGFVITSEAQLDRLIEQGIFIDDETRSKKLDTVQGDTTPPSACRLLNDARNKLAQAAQQYKQPAFQLEPLANAICSMIKQACAVNKDVALAMVQLRQNGSYAVRHLIDTAAVCCIVGRSMQLPEAELNITIKAAISMNLGMIDVQDRLNSFSNELTPAIQQAIQTHPDKGADILRSLGVVDEDWLNMVAQHHEAEDGSGYPHGLRGNAILRGAKLIGMADKYCARISTRDSRPVALANVALRELFLERGQTVDPVIAAYFVREVGIYPPGTVVRLVNGETGIVSKAGSVATSPWVHSLIGPRGAPLSFPVRRKTVESLYEIKEVVDPRKIDFPVRLQAIWGSDAAGC